MTVISPTRQEDKKVYNLLKIIPHFHSPSLKTDHEPISAQYQINRNPRPAFTTETVGFD